MDNPKKDDASPLPYNQISAPCPCSLPSSGQSAPQFNRNYRPPPLKNRAYLVPGGRTTTSSGKKLYITLEPSLSNNSQKLFNVLRKQIRLPIRPYLDIHGERSYTVTSYHDGKKETRTKWFTDFRFSLDLAETLLAGWEDTSWANRWVRVEAVKDGDNKPAFRGSRRRTCEYKASRSKKSADEAVKNWIELQEMENGEVASGAGDSGDADLSGMNDVFLWCERYCDDPSPVKSFTFERSLRGFDIGVMRSALWDHIRAQGYLGRIRISLNYEKGSFTIYSPHWINRLRFNNAVWWICVIFGLWIITWPVIYFMEKRYQVVRVWWDSSYRVDGEVHDELIYPQGRDEAELAKFWGPAVKHAVWARRRDMTLTKRDAEQLRTARRH